MLLQGLRAYRDNAMPPDTPIPPSFSIQCVPGQSKFLKIKEYIEPEPGISPATVDASQQVFGRISFSRLPLEPKKEPGAFFGRHGLEFFVKPGKATRSSIHTCLTICSDNIHRRFKCI